MNDAEIHIPPYKNTEPLVIGNQVFQSVYDFTLTEKDLERALTELGETDERKEACLLELKEKLLSNESVKYRLDDSYLLRFLRIRKYDVNKAYQNMKNLYEMRQKHQVFFTLHKEIKFIEQLNILTCSPYTDEEGRLIFFYNMGRWNPYELSFDQMSTTVANVSEVTFTNPKIQINGSVAILDCSDLTLKHYYELLRFGRLRMFISLATQRRTKLRTKKNGYPARIKKVIIINSTRYMRYIYSITKAFLNKKLSERVILLGSDMNDFHQHVNPALLPKRFNGSLEEEELDMSQFILDNLPYIRYERSFKFSK